MKRRRDAYCGLYCGACPVFIANEQGRVAEFARQKNAPPDDFICYGCKSEQVSPWCTTCNLKHCAREKGFEFCFECPELPCDNLKGFIADSAYPYHFGVMKNLNVIREHGVDTWLQAQDERWRCLSCSARFAWQTETCTQCGVDVPNYRADL